MQSQLLMTNDQNKTKCKPWYHKCVTYTNARLDGTQPVNTAVYNSQVTYH